MSTMLIIGAGVMGSALAATAVRAGRVEVLLAGSPLDDEIIAGLRHDGRHTDLDVELPSRLECLTDTELDADRIRSADVIVLGVSSPGVDWAIGRLRDAGAHPELLALVTKGLVPPDDETLPPSTYAERIPALLDDESVPLVGIGGPCIARELALELPTRVCLGARDRVSAGRFRDLVQTPFYSATLAEDITGLEACAALKNFLCIGVSAWLTRYRVGDEEARNPVAALYSQAVLEMALLADWIRRGASRSDVDATVVRESPDVAFDLPGLGDLHVTVGGGRNSRLGRHLGEGQCLRAVVSGPMRGITVEGVDTGRVLAEPLRAACGRGRLDPARLPLTLAILDAIEHDTPFDLDLDRLPG